MPRNKPELYFGGKSKASGGKDKRPKKKTRGK